MLTLPTSKYTHFRCIAVILIEGGTVPLSSIVLVEKLSHEEYYHKLHIFFFQYEEKQHLFQIRNINPIYLFLFVSIYRNIYNTYIVMWDYNDRVTYYVLDFYIIYQCFKYLKNWQIVNSIHLRISYIFLWNPINNFERQVRIFTSARYQNKRFNYLIVLSIFCKLYFNSK